MSAMRQRIVDLYGARVLRKSAMNIRDGAGVFERVLSGKGYRTVLEIGTYRGVSAAEMSQFVERVVTFDLRIGKLEHNQEQWEREAFWQALGISNITLHLVGNDREKARLIEGMEFDFAFIDGAHDAKSVAFDFALVHRCGRVLFHDYDKRGGPGQDDVYNFINSLPAREVTPIDIFALWEAP